ncbi:MAG: hypothetical protein OQK51_23265 [Kangiellaceae bacterium]|nr:hypothetical protein [Kangiellaceae bacterium]
MKNKLVGILGICGLLAFNVQAERPSFNFVEAGATDLDHETVEGDFTGFEISGSYELPDDFYIIGKYVTTEDEGIEMSNKLVGIGYHYHLFKNTVLVLQLDAVEVVFGRRDAGEFEEKGFQWNLGIRSQITDALEAGLTAKYLDAYEVDPEFGNYRPSYLTLDLSYKVYDEVAFYLEYEKEKEGSTRSVLGFKYYY